MAINRYKLVSRHSPVVKQIDAYSPLTVGNGEFAFTADITGMQTFPLAYQEGVPLCTQSQWGWHTRPAGNEEPAFHINDMKTEVFKTHSKEVGYITSAKGQEEGFHWLRTNPHRLHLGRIGMQVHKDDGMIMQESDIQNPHQLLDLWTGLLHSSFAVENVSVRTQTCCHPAKDAVAFHIQSDLLLDKRIGVVISFPYGSPDKAAADWQSEARHDTAYTTIGDNIFCLKRAVDQDAYYVTVSLPKGASMTQTGKHEFTIMPGPHKKELELVCWFTKSKSNEECPSFLSTVKESEDFWVNYWNQGGMITFAGSTDNRAMELERRIVLSQYLMAVQCAGTLPPQETGLTFNSWYGKYHLEMHWWHGVHFMLWGRPKFFERSLGWYRTILPKAKVLAQSQGYQGVRWPKMVSFDGVDSPSHIGPLLIWQQPHPIYYAELLYQLNPDRETLEQYSEIVFESAAFMASYAEYDTDTGRYVLGPGLIPAQENHKPQVTLNPAFELEYWAFGLITANAWRERMGLEPMTLWENVAQNLAELPVKDGVYIAHENCPDTFTRFNEDHPSMLGAMGVLPGTKVDPVIMRKTLLKVFKQWKMDKVWGWDFPMMAMTAARLQEPELAVRALMHTSPKNEYLVNGHNKQADKKELPIYLPGNGGLLSAIAMMAVGWRGCTESSPGFPKDGAWNVEWEGLHAIL